MDNQTFREIANYLNQQLCKPVKGVVLGDCSFQTSWSSGDNRLDLSRFAELLGISQIDSIDIYGNPTLRIDLNQELIESTLIGQCDVVFDIGTSMCCFNPMSCLSNIHSMLAVGGLSINLCGITGYFGRCYYNIHPDLFIDYFRVNDYSIELAKVRTSRQIKYCDTTLVDCNNKDFLSLFENVAQLASHGIYSSSSRPPHSEIPSILPNECDFLIAAKKLSNISLRTSVPVAYEIMSRERKEPVLCSYSPEEIEALRKL